MSDRTFRDIEGMKRLQELFIKITRENIEDNHEKPRDSPTSIAQIIANGVNPLQYLFITMKWIVAPLEPATDIRLVWASNTEQ